MIAKLISIYSMYDIYIITGAIFIAIFLLVLSIGLMVIARKNTRDTVMGKLTYYSIEEGGEVKVPSFFERVIKPVLNRVSGGVRKISTSGVAESIRHKLELAGILETLGVNIYLMIKFLFAIVFLIIVILLLVFFDFPLIVNLILLALIPVSYFFPDIYLNNKINNRQEEIRKVLPNALDMLTITVEAGMGFDIALSRVANNIKGVLGEELNKMLSEINIGLTRKEAFSNLVKRTNVPDLDTFVASIIQADILGISVGKILRVQASEIRNRRSVRAEEAGIKAPVKLIFPLIICLMPALLVVIVGPAIITVYENLINFLMK
jgi:tight adherence protein C